MIILDQRFDELDHRLDIAGRSRHQLRTFVRLVNELETEPASIIDKGIGIEISDGVGIGWINVRSVLRQIA